MKRKEKFGKWIEVAVEVTDTVACNPKAQLG